MALPPRAQPQRWRPVSEALVAHYDTLQGGWATFVAHDRARLACIALQDEPLQAIAPLAASVLAAQPYRHAINLSSLAIACVAVGRRDDAAGLLTAAEEATRGGLHAKTQAATYGHLATGYARLGDAPKAQQFRELAIAQGDAENNPGESVRSLAWSYLEADEPARAVETLCARGLHHTAVFHAEALCDFALRLLDAGAHAPLAALLERVELRGHDGLLFRLLDRGFEAGLVGSWLHEARRERRDGWVYESVLGAAAARGALGFLASELEGVFAEPTCAPMTLRWAVALDRGAQQRAHEKVSAAARSPHERFGALLALDAALGHAAAVEGHLRAMIDPEQGTAALSVLGAAKAHEALGSLARQLDARFADAPEPVNARAKIGAMRAFASAGLAAEAEARAAPIFSLVTAPRYPDASVAQALCEALAAHDMPELAMKALRKVKGKIRRERALREVLRLAGRCDRPEIALEALARFVKERPNDVNPLRAALDAWEFQLRRRGLWVAYDPL